MRAIAVGSDNRMQRRGRAVMLAMFMCRHTGAPVVVMAFAHSVFTCVISVVIAACRVPQVHANRTIVRQAYKHRRRTPAQKLGRKQHSGEEPAEHGIARVDVRAVFSHLFYSIG